SFVAGFFATLVGSERLLLVAALVLGACAGLLIIIDRTLEPLPVPVLANRSGDSPPGAWHSLQRSNHLRTIAYILGVTVIVSTLLDWQLSKAVELFIPSEDGKTAFFGHFFTLLNIASVLIQFFLTSWVLRVFGVGVALLLLPLGILTGSIGILLHPGLWTTVLAKGAEGALRYSLDQSTRELLYLPVPLELKLRVKPLIDLVVYRGGTGVAGVILLVATGPLGFGLRQIALIVIAVIGFWMGLTLAMRREFRASVKKLIATRDVEARELLIKNLDAATRGELVQALESRDENAALYALTLLEGVDDRSIFEHGERLLRHPSDRVRASTLRIMVTAQRVAADQDDHAALVRELVHDPAVEVRMEAAHYLSRYGSESERRMVLDLCRSSEPPVRAAALGFLALHGDREQSVTARAALTRMAIEDGGATSSAARAVATEALGVVVSGGTPVAQVLAHLTHDDDPDVRSAALQAAGRTHNTDQLPHLTSALCCGSARAVASRALAGYGQSAFPVLTRYLKDDSVPLTVRVVIPTVFYLVGGQTAVDELVRILPRTRPAPVRRAILKTLGRLRRNQAGLIFNERLIERTLLVDLRETYQFVADRSALEPGSLLARVLIDHERRGLERITRVLGLIYPQSDIHAAYQGLTSGDPAQRGAGLELLDHTVSIAHRRLIVPLADPDLPIAARVARGAAMIRRVVVEDRDAVLRRLAKIDGHAWLAAAAAVEAGLSSDAHAEGVAEPFHEHPLPRVNTTFRQLLTPKGGEMTLKLVERADFLRDVPTFSQVQIEDLARIAAIAEEWEYEEGEDLYREGDEGTHMFHIVSGELLATRGGREIFRAARGATVGALAVIDERPREWTLTALRHTRVLAIARDDFYDLMKDHFNLVEGLLVHLARVVRELGDPSQPEAAVRVAH
ncbi:MAG: Npt1/Npt2 family nucleotide transporter, partial [Gemmatimonadales bacterium]